MNTENDSNDDYNTLIELMAEVGDRLSEFQDKVVDEAYLNMRRRINHLRKSLRKSPRLTLNEKKDALNNMRNILLSLENLHETDQKKPKKCFMKCRKFKLSFWS